MFPHKKYFCIFGVIRTLLTRNNIKSLTSHRQEVRYLQASFIIDPTLSVNGLSIISSTTYISSKLSILINEHLIIHILAMKLNTGAGPLILFMKGKHNYLTWNFANKLFVTKLFL